MKDINDLIGKNNIIYVTNDPERSLGVEKILDNFYTLCIDDSYILNFLNNYYSLKRTIPNIDIFRNSNKLLQQKQIKQYLSSIDNKSFMFFKIAPNLELSLKDNSILNTKSNLNRKYENKITVSEIFKDIVPPTIRIDLSNDNYEKITNVLGKSFVIQFSRGQSGNTTFFINNKDEFEDIKRDYPLRIAKAVKRIEGEYYTINAVITKNNLFVGNLSKQITGIKDLTTYKGGSVGNDWVTNLNVRQKDQFIKKMRTIGEKMKSDGYIGMFGADFVFDSKNAFLIEINARENASIPTYSKIQIEQGIIPFKLIHILEFLKIEYPLDEFKINNAIYDDYNLRQIIIRNTNKYPVKIKRTLNGVYSKNLDKIKDGYDIDYLSYNQYLILTVLGDINPNLEIVRIQSRENIPNTMINTLLKIIAN